MRFSFDKIPDLSGKVAIVTGGNTGIGIITARELARKNAHVFVASRSRDRGESAVELIKKETKNDAVEFLQLDLQSLNSVKHAAETFLARKLPLHILPFATTVDGIQDQFGTNHIGHFVFTLLLLPTIKASAPSRIVNTELTRGVVADWGSWVKPIISLVGFFKLSADDGALTQLYCATSPEIEEKNLRGLYFVPFGEVGEPSTQAKDEELAKKLWDFSESFGKGKLGDDIFSKSFA
ncbi:8353_t:CDS:2 [Dentiscutata erythropus]|uniref:8353_t:CDS:1 n=1 Tax=Dentiscutata erythropus TaxID=1348616 RepID=A0A9N9JH77_9GLOM|nr:8353_t:CDS:2 [Dentiscutata erythropus]